jgi:hypothetical protein
LEFLTFTAGGEVVKAFFTKWNAQPKLLEQGK